MMIRLGGDLVRVTSITPWNNATATVGNEWKDTVGIRILSGGFKSQTWRSYALEKRRNKKWQLTSDILRKVLVGVFWG
jgi:hypothetical protein